MLRVQCSWSPRRNDCGVSALSSSSVLEGKQAPAPRPLPGSKNPRHLSPMQMEGGCSDPAAGKTRREEWRSPRGGRNHTTAGAAELHRGSSVAIPGPESHCLGPCARSCCPVVKSCAA